MSPLPAGLIMLVLLAGSFTDLRRRVVPNRLTLGAALCGLALAAAAGPPALASAALTGAAVSAPLMAISLLRPDGLGMGDAKMVAVLGIFLGWQALLALLAGCLLAGLTGTLLALRGRRPPSQVALPLVPFLAAGTLPVVLFALKPLQ